MSSGTLRVRLLDVWDPWMWSFVCVLIRSRFMSQWLRWFLMFASVGKAPMWTLGGVWSALAGVGVFGGGLFPGRVIGCGVCPRHTDTGLIWFTEHCVFPALSSFPFSKPLSRSAPAEKPETCRWAVNLRSRFTCRPHCGTGDHQAEVDMKAHGGFEVILQQPSRVRTYSKYFWTWLDRGVINLLTLQYKVCETLFTLTCN